MQRARRQCEIRPHGRQLGQEQTRGRDKAPQTAPPAPAAPRRPRQRRRPADNRIIDRRLHEGGPARRQGADGREGARTRGSCVKLTIDVGTEQRTLVAGIAEAYEPEALVGRTIVIVFNLKPAKLMGIESNGMVLAASPDGGKPTLVGFDQDVPPGHGSSVSAVSSVSADRLSHCHLGRLRRSSSGSILTAPRGEVRSDSAVVARAAARLTARCASSARATRTESARGRGGARARGRRCGSPIGIHPHQAGEFAGDVDARGRRRCAERRATSRRVRDRRDRPRLPLRLLAARRPAGGLPARRSRWRASCGCRSSSTPARRPTTRSRSCATTGAGDVRGVFHCFTGDEAMARAALDLGFYLSFAGIVTFPRAEAICATRRRIVPADRLLTETDAPYLAPVPHRGKRNEPALRRAGRARRWRRFAASAPDELRGADDRATSTRCSAASWRQLSQ